ncbi:MAG TPA: hypothetical protein VGI12_09830 [Vicinamibacterales bacterium]|jgi:hypothetical protein
MWRILATLRIDGGRLHVEAMSRARDERCRTWLASLAPDLEYRATSLESVAAALARLEQGPPAPAAPSDLPPDVKAGLERQLQDEHCRRWLDEQVPALGFMTPREAVRSRKHRPALIEVLRGFDNHYERALRQGSQAYDSAWLWEALELDPDSPAKRRRPSDRTPR